LSFPHFSFTYSLSLSHSHTHTHAHSPSLRLLLMSQYLWMWDFCVVTKRSEWKHDAQTIFSRLNDNLTITQIAAASEDKLSNSLNTFRGQKKVSETFVDVRYDFGTYSQKLLWSSYAYTF
jgi:hypothetical protein